jgi:hypothetical protein
MLSRNQLQPLRLGTGAAENSVTKHDPCRTAPSSVCLSNFSTLLLYQASPFFTQSLSFLKIINPAVLIKEVDGWINSKILINDFGTTEKSGTSCLVTSFSMTVPLTVVTTT